MIPQRATAVLIGQVLVSAGAKAFETAEAVGLADRRVVAVGRRDDVLDAAASGADVRDFGEAAIVPGLCDFHLHLVGMASSRREVRLDEARTTDELIAAMATAARAMPPDGWLRGRGWHDAVLAATDLDRLDRAIEHRPALVSSHDGHSAWASPAAMARAGADPSTRDPAGGRLERDGRGAPNGILRERAVDLVERIAGALRGAALESALEETLAELAGLGITAAVDAGDATADGGSGTYAGLGDSASTLLGSPSIDGRLRLWANVPAAAINEAGSLGLRSGDPVPERRTVRLGWAKAFVDGALGSRTAATFDPYTCGEAGDMGLARLTDGELDALVVAARDAGIGLAIHAIGDRGAAMVLDALERGPQRSPVVPPDRMEHLQLMRPRDITRLTAADVTASLQPIHCASDRSLVDACWADRAALAYPWRELERARTRLAFGSDAPIESANPWLGVFAALHRRFAGDGTPDWQPQQALDVTAALAGYTTGPAAAGGWTDLGHLRPGARADLAVLTVGLESLRRGEDDLADVRSQLTLLDGQPTHVA